MKKTLLAVAVLATATAATAAPYVQGNLSRTTFTKQATNDDNAIGARIAVGNDAGDFRYAVDYANYGELKDKYSVGTSTATDKMTVNSIGATGIFDFNTNTAITPYAGARVGVNRIDYKESIDGVSAKDDTTAVGVGLIGGVQFAVSDSLAIDAGVEYNKLGRVKIKDGNGNKVGDYQPTQKGLNVGVRYNF